MGVEIKATKLMTALKLSVLPTLEHNVSNQGSDLYHSIEHQRCTLTMRLLPFPQDIGGGDGVLLSVVSCLPYSKASIFCCGQLFLGLLDQGKMCAPGHSC